MKKILIFIFVALSIGVAVALKMYGEGENDIEFIIAMAMAMVVAIAIAYPKRFNVSAPKGSESRSTYQDQSDLPNRWSKPIRNIAAAVFLVTTPITMYLRGERNIEAIAIFSFLMASIPFLIYFRIQQVVWQFENDESIYKGQPDLREKLSIPLGIKNEKNDAKED